MRHNPGEPSLGLSLGLSLLGRQSGLHRGGGFTVLDVMAAILVATIGIAGLLAMQLTSLSANLRARELIEATQLCLDRVEQIKAGPLPIAANPTGGEIVDSRGCPLVGSSRPSCARLTTGINYTRTWTVDATNRFQVTTSWTSGDGTIHSVVMTDAY